MTRIEMYDRKESIREDIHELKMQLAYAEENELSAQTTDEIVLRITVLYARFDGLVLMESLLRAGTHVPLDGGYIPPLSRGVPGSSVMGVSQIPALFAHRRNECGDSKEATAEYVVA